MRKDFVKTVIERKLFIIIVVIMLMLSGVYSYISIPKQNFPEVVLPVASVSAVYPGAYAEDMEELVTKKLEETVMTLHGFDNCTTQTTDGVSAVMVSLDMSLSKESVNESFDDLRLKIDNLKGTLPSGVTNLSVDTDIMDTAGLLLAVTGDGISGDEMAQRTNELKDKLKLLEGVNKVKVVGEQLSEVLITVDSSKLNSMDISLAELASIISAQNSLIPTGTLDVGDNVIKLNSSGKFESIDEIKNIVIWASPRTGIIKTLSDVADVEVSIPDDSPRYYYIKNPSTVVALYFDSGINVVSMGDSIRNTVDEFSKTLPDNIQVNEIYFQSDVVNTAVNGFVLNLLESIVLVLVVVMVGMSLRNGIVVSIAIPLAILTSFILMPVFRVEIQFVSLAALIVVLGMLVDNSIVVNDSIQTRLDHGEDRFNAAVHGTAEVAVPVFVSMLTTVAGFSSLLTLSGAYKQLAYSLPVVIIACLIVSFLVSLFVTPLMSYFFLKKSKKKKGDSAGKLAKVYDRLFQAAFNNKQKTILLAIVFFLICASSIVFIDLEIVAKADKDVVTVEIDGNSETDIHKTEKVIEQIQDVLDEQPEVKYYLSSVGMGIPRYDYSVLPKGQGSDVGDIFVRIDLSKGNRFENTGAMVEYLQNELDTRVTGGKLVVDELGVMAMTTKPVEMRVFSDNLDDLNEATDKIAKVMKGIEGTKNVDLTRDVATYSYYVDMDTNNLNTLGLSKAEVQNELSIALLGRDVSLYRENGKEYNVVLESDLSSPEMLENYKVKSSASGVKYALHQFSDLTLFPQLTVINRLDGQRGRAVGCYAAAGNSSISLQSELEKQLKNIEFPDSVRVEKSGEKKEYINLIGSIIGAAAVSFVLIFMILIVQFNSIKKALMVFISFPFGAVAGIAGLYITGQKLSLFALLGIISLMGCVLANAIVLIEFINEEKSKGINSLDACKLAGAKRFRPILMSTMTTVLGLFPLAIGGDTLFIPMSILLMFGLAVSMVMNLILVPIVYYMVDSRDEDMHTQVGYYGVEG